MLGGAWRPAERDLSAWEQQLQGREEQLEQSLTADLASWWTLKANTDEILGVGLEVTRGGPGSREPSEITAIRVSQEYISWSAYLRTRGKRMLDPNFRLDYWIPLFMLPEHGVKAAPFMEEAVYCIIMETEQVGRPLAETHTFLPLMAASALATLMNCLVVRPRQRIA